jgi:mono/diheme cytochrome c family protein
MRLRPSLLVFPVLAVALLASGCFEAKTAGTVSTPITVAVGTGETEVNPAASSSTPATTTATGATAGTTAATSTGTSTSGGAPAYPASAKAKFATTCGACHTLANAGTTGQVGPNLDTLKPDAARVLHQIQVGGGPMPPGLLTGQDAQDVANYVAAVAGKGA